MKILQLNFVPRSVDFALLVLRLWFGLTLAFQHGWAKLTGFSAMKTQFPDPLHVGPTLSLTLATFAEFFCSLLVVIGLWTRFGALMCSIMLLVAFTLIHHGALSKPGGGELAFAYLGAFVTLFIAGGGRFSLDGRTSTVVVTETTTTTT